MYERVSLLFALLLLTTTLHAKVLELSPNEKHVVERKYPSEEERRDEVERDRIRRDISSELSHTHTNLTGDAHKFAAIHWSGLKESSVIFIHTYDTSTASTLIESSSIWRSENYGASFANQLSLFDSNATISSFSYSDVDVSSIVLTDLTNRVLYVSRDEGATYARVGTQVGFSWLDFYPGSSTVLAAYDSAGLTMWGSVDGGSSWFKMRDGVHKYAFGDTSNGISMMYVITQDQLLYTIAIDPSDSKQPKLTDSQLGKISLSRMEKVGDYLFVEKQVDNDVQLWISHKNSAFHRGHFATETYTTQQVYHITSVHEKQILVILTHINNRAQGELFLSDETGTFYTLSLEKVFIISSGALSLSDVYVVSGMNGTLVANVFEDGNVVTMISYDSGAEWSKLTSPASDCYPPSCSLNFLMSISAFINRIQTAIFSKTSAVGILLAHGTDGKTVQYQAASSKVGLYISRDGGQRWSRTQEGTWLVTFADYAGVIAAVQDFRSPQVTELSYSFDEGSTWYTYTFSHNEVTIGGLLTEPGEATLVDVLFAYDSNNRESEWEIVTVNYSNILSTPCQQSDYEEWSPYNARVGRDCLLGSTVTWQRKKPTAVCYNGPNFNRVVKTAICQCAIEDYECDWGYKHPSIDSQSCLLDSKQPSNRYAPECSEGVANFSYTQGFRKIAGDVCIDGESSLYEPIVKPCTATKLLSFSTGLKDSYVEIGQMVTFTLQVANELSYDKYYWDFGDKHKGNFPGLSVNHSYSVAGRQNVAVSSPDSRYSDNETIIVVNLIHDAIFSYSYGMQVGAKTVFNAFLLTESSYVVDSEDDSPLYFGYTHFSVWYNDTGMVRASDELTQQFIFEHNFPSPGQFSMKITVSGPLNSITEKFQITVFEKVFVLELTFSQIFNISQPQSPKLWLAQVNVVLTDKLNELKIISSDPEINIQPNSNIVYVTLNGSDSTVDFNALLHTLQTNIDLGLIAISLANFHASVVSVRDVTDLIGLEVNDNSGAYVGAIVFLVLIILSLAFLLTLSVVIIMLMMKLCKQTNTQSRQGPNNRVYMHLRDDNGEMEPLTVESDDEHLLPAEPQSEARSEGQQTEATVET